MKIWPGPGDQAHKRHDGNGARAEKKPTRCLDVASPVVGREYLVDTETTEKAAVQDGRQMLTVHGKRFGTGQKKKKDKKKRQ